MARLLLVESDLRALTFNDDVQEYVQSYNRVSRKALKTFDEAMALADEAEERGDVLAPR